MTQALDLTLTIYRAHKAAKDLFKEQYPARIEKYKRLILSRMKQKKLEPLTAVMDILPEMKELAGEGIGEMMLLAAVVELLETDKS